MTDQAPAAREPLAVNWPRVSNAARPGPADEPGSPSGTRGKTRAPTAERDAEPVWSRHLASHRHLSGFVVIAGMAILAHAELANHGEVATQVATLVGGVLGALAWRRRGETMAQRASQPTPRPTAGG